MSLEYKYPFGKNGQYCNPAEFASAVFFKNENPRISFHWINNAFVENLFGRIPLDFRVFLKIRWIVFECRTRFSKIQRILIFFEWNFFFRIRWIWKIGEKAQYLKSSGFGIFVTKILQSRGIPLFAVLTERWKKSNTAQCIPAEFACFFSKIRWIYCYRTGPKWMNHVSKRTNLPFMFYFSLGFSWFCLYFTSYALSRVSENVGKHWNLYNHPSRFIN